MDPILQYGIQHSHFKLKKKKDIEKRKQQCYRVVTTHNSDLGRLSIYIHTYTYSLDQWRWGIQRQVIGIIRLSCTRIFESIMRTPSHVRMYIYRHTTDRSNHIHTYRWHLVWNWRSRRNLYFNCVIFHSAALQLMSYRVNRFFGRSCKSFQR